MTYQRMLMSKCFVGFHSVSTITIHELCTKYSCNLSEKHQLFIDRPTK